MRKFSILPILALVIAVAASAFGTKAADAGATDSHWYQFNGDATDLQEVQDESKYVLVSAPQGCSSNQYICAIFVPGDGAPNSQPDAFSQTILDDLEDAFDRTSVAGYIEMKPSL